MILEKNGEQCQVDQYDPEMCNFRCRHFAFSYLCIKFMEKLDSISYDCYRCQQCLDKFGTGEP